MDLKNNGKTPNGTPPIYTLNVRGKLLTLATPKVMGILNVTEDSFYADSRVGAEAGGRGGAGSVNVLIDKAGRMLEEGAAFLDIGGQSTRPGSIPLTAAEETDRVIPVIEALGSHFPDALLSIDTYHSAVARAAVGAGACLVNDISAGHMDPGMIPAVSSLHVPYIAMHMQGTPQTMQADPQYENVTREVIQSLAAAAGKAADAGIHDIIVDPGFGFGKTAAHNFRLLDQLELLALLGRPILVGLSRKSMIYTTLKTTPEKALNGTTALNMVALRKGAHILRVHDVREAAEAIQLMGALDA